MVLYQRQGIFQYYIGWYGVCDESGAPDASDSDAPCQTLNLVTSRYQDDNTFIEWSNGKGAFREQLTRVAQIRGVTNGTASSNGIDYSFYDMDVIRNLRSFYVQLGYSTTDAIAQADLVTANPPNSNIEFDQMICGKAYTIIVAPGTGGASRGAIVSQVSIPEFRFTYVGDADSGLRLTPECCGYSE